MHPLTESDAAVLEIASRAYRYQSSREQAALSELGMTWFVYVQRLNALLDSEAALAHAPVVVARLRRVRDANLRVRAS